MGYVRIPGLECRNVNIAEEVYYSLVDKGFLEADSIGRGTKYLLSSMFNIESSSPIDDGDNIVNDVKLKDNEIKILNYVIQNGYITNSICKSELGLEKYKSVRLFNSLIKK